MSLTCVHFVVTTCGMEIARRCDLFLVKSLPLKDMVLLSLSFCGFVVLTNLSLQSNTVGTYQISKFMTTPCVMLIQSFFFEKTFQWNLKLTLVPVCLGVLINNYNDIQLNTTGLLYASSGVVVTSIYQVWVGSKQHEFQANSMQLLYYQAPLSAAFLMLIILFVEPPFSVGGVFNQIWSMAALFFVLCSGAVAFLVNLSIFWVIGSTSPLTYNMAGHLKFCLIACGGFLIFHELPTLYQLLGIILTISGVLAYTYIKLEEQKKPVEGKPSSRSHHSV
ncbi:solute carrier family 35 member E3-like [Watersipora subatra]|uniref:solute carrier family 35 member E3-like n=1 Tax=Watersipora subatra TaxID=2589382 RepID=UPI00355B1EAE